MEGSVTRQPALTATLEKKNGEPKSKMVVCIQPRRNCPHPSPQQQKKDIFAVSTCTTLFSWSPQNILQELVFQSMLYSVSKREHNRICLNMLHWFYYFIFFYLSPQVMFLLLPLTPRARRILNAAKSQTSKTLLCWHDRQSVKFDDAGLQTADAADRHTWNSFSKFDIRSTRHFKQTPSLWNFILTSSA